MQDSSVSAEEIARLTELVRDLCIEMTLSGTHYRRRHPTGRAEEVFLEGGNLMLRFWSVDEQQRRKVRTTDISELLETNYGTVFSSFDEWIADLERSPRYKPDSKLTKRWYKVRDFVPYFRNLASAHPPTEAPALLILDEFIVWRLTEGSIGRITEPEITAIVERGRLEPFMPHEAELFHFSGSKRQATRILEVAEGMAALAPADEARRNWLERARLLLSL